MSDTIIQVENLWKEYRLGVINHHSLTRDLQSRWAKLWGKEDPNSPVDVLATQQTDDNRFWALKDVSFEVNKGDILGIIGRNGAGKSTLLKILSQVTAPTKGEVRIKGRISSLLEVGTGFHPELTGRENIFLNGAILGMHKDEIRKKLDEIIDFAEVDKFVDTPVKRYSSGMYVRLAFAVAAHLEPEILVIDEVLAVGDAQFQKKCLGKMEEIGKKGRTILFVSHQLNMIENLCSRTILLSNGNVEKQGDTKEVLVYYLKDVIETAIFDNDLATRVNRSGCGSIILTSFRVEDYKGNKLSAVQSGMDIVFVFGYKCQKTKNLDKVDIGFSIHSTFNNQTFTVLYSSYKGTTFDAIYDKGFFQCRIDHFPFSAGKYLIGARITVNGVEADWPFDGVGFIEVVEGDFFGTGNKGFDGNTPFLVDGKWSHS